MGSAWSRSRRYGNSDERTNPADATTTAPREHGTPPQPPHQVDVEMPEEHSGSVIDMLGQRKGSMLEMGSTSPEGILSVVYEARSRRYHALDAP